MLPMPVVPERPPVCRLHRFGDQVPKAVVGVKLCSEGHGHQVDRKLYRCLACGFPMTMPLES